MQGVSLHVYTNAFSQQIMQWKQKAHHDKCGQHRLLPELAVGALALRVVVKGALACPQGVVACLAHHKRIHPAPQQLPIVIISMT